MLRFPIQNVQGPTLTGNPLMYIEDRVPWAWFLTTILLSFTVEGSECWPYYILVWCVVMINDEITNFL